MLFILSFILPFCCVPLSPLDAQGIQKSEIIFVGELLEKSRDDNKDVHADTKFHFEVIEAFKGCQRGDIIIVRSNEMISTGIHPQIGDKWLLIPYGSESHGWYTDICSYSSNISKKRAMKDLRFLRRQSSK